MTSTPAFKGNRVQEKIITSIEINVRLRKAQSPIFPLKLGAGMGALWKIVEVPFSKPPPILFVT
jgi:hypothetical protein